MQQLKITAQFGLPAAPQATQLHKAQTLRQEIPAGDKSASFDAKLSQAKEEAIAPKEQPGAQIKDADTRDSGSPDSGEATETQAQPPDRQEEAPEDSVNETELWIGSPAVVMLTQTAQAPTEGDGAI